MVNSLMDTPSEKQDDSPRPADNDEQNTPDEMSSSLAFWTRWRTRISTSFPQRKSKKCFCKWKELNRESLRWAVSDPSPPSKIRLQPTSCD